MNERTDSELLRQYAEGASEAAFSELLGRYVDLVYSAALRMIVDPHLAEDVTQMTFAALAKQARNLAGRQCLGSWLHRTASNLAAAAVRTEMRRRNRDTEAFNMGNEQQAEPDWTEVAGALDAALNELDEGERNVVLLRYFKKLTAREIGQFLAVSEEAAQKRVARAMEQLRRAMMGKGVTLSAGALAAMILSQGVVAAPAGLSASIATLAGGGAAGALAGAGSFIFMSKIKMITAGVLAIVGIATPLVLQHQNIRSLQSEKAALEAQSAQAESLLEENRKLAAELTSERERQGVSKAQFTELNRLRGEVSALRRESQELAKLRQKSSAAETPKDDLRAGKSPAFVASGAWANVGIENPTNAIQTLFWAGKQSETNLVRDLLRWRREPGIPAAPELDEILAKGLVGGVARFGKELEGFRALSETIDGPDSAALTLEMLNQDGTTQTQRIRLVREENLWFPVMNVFSQEKGSIRAALEVPEKANPKTN